jgi:hypothetical protein
MRRGGGGGGEEEGGRAYPDVLARIIEYLHFSVSVRGGDEASPGGSGEESGVERRHFNIFIWRFPNA